MIEVVDFGPELPPLAEAHGLVVPTESGWAFWLGDGLVAHPVLGLCRLVEGDEDEEGHQP